MCDTYIWRNAKHIHKSQTHPLVREDVTQGLRPQGYSCKKKISGRESQGARRQDEMTGGKPPVVKWVWYDFDRGEYNMTRPGIKSGCSD
jgi:hypothetical protein